MVDIFCVCGSAGSCLRRARFFFSHATAHPYRVPGLSLASPAIRRSVHSAARRRSRWRPFIASAAALLAVPPAALAHDALPALRIGGSKRVPRLYVTMCFTRIAETVHTIAAYRRGWDAAREPHRNLHDDYPRRRL